MNLQPTRQRPFNKSIFGYDIETYNDNKNMYCASIYSVEGKTVKTFYRKEAYKFLSEQELKDGEVTDFFKKTLFAGSVVVATNLSFDFFGSFHSDIITKYFRTLFRGSNLIMAKTTINKHEYGARGDYGRTITFLDTLNYVPFSVKKLGEIINIPKLPKPRALGKLPKNKTEHEELVTYNQQDARISAEFFRFLMQGFQKLGASPKITIASTAMSIFKNKYLHRTYKRHEVPDLLQQFNAYYGGRVEAFSRGKIVDYNYYDFNSLYPSVMREEYPDPDSVHYSNVNKTRYLDADYEGISHVTVSVPEHEYYPLLPLRHDNKLLFPTGTFTGWYNNEELRHATKYLGVNILKVKKSIYCKDNCVPFRDYIDDIYSLRREYQKRHDPMQVITKLSMNSLYGKFGQKFVDKDNYVPKDSLSFEQLDKLDFVEPFGEWYRTKHTSKNPPAFTIPLWASSVTAKARLKLHDLIRRCHPVYVDTDSVITTKDLETSSKLGKLKLEMRIKEGIIVKPKMYMINGMVKAKGIGRKLVMQDFDRLLLERKISYPRFVKFKEALRRGLTVNEIVEITKHLNLEDNKRVWPEKFSPETLQHSKPINNPLGTGSTTEHPTGILMETTIK